MTLSFLPKNASTTSIHDVPREPRLKLLVAANGPKDVAFAQAVAVRLSKDPKLSIKVIVDELTHRLTQEFPAELNRHLQRYNMEATKDIDLAQRHAFELVEWADLLLLAPIDADHLAKMMAGITDTLLLEVLRSWDASKRIILVPGMSTHMWENPVTKRQMSKLHRKWQWIRVLPPILWHFDNSQNPLATGKRIVEWGGFNDVIGIIKNQADLLSLGHDVDVAAQGRQLANFKKADCRLPPELWSMIIEATGDWELAEALGVFTNLPMPMDQGWRRHPKDPNDPLQVFMHELEWTLVTADTDAICKKLSEAPATIHDLSALAIKLIFKFSLTKVLTYMESHCPLVFRNFDGKTIPTKASAFYGLTEILDWWARSPSFLEKQYDAEAIDGASRHGYVHVLEWWQRSGLPLKYTETALEQASARGHVQVLEWWREASLVNSDILLKPGRSLILAAQHGQLAVLRWWEESGVSVGHQDFVCKAASRWGQVEVLELWRELRGDNKMTFNSSILIEPTIHSHIGVLDWWKRYAHATLPGMNGRRAKRVEYKTMDIEEALEDSLGDQTAVRRWWAENGLNLGIGTSEWMKLRYL
jgi:hypothetical protein